MTSVNPRGGAPPWREMFLMLGFDDADPAKDGRRVGSLSERIAARTPGQLAEVVVFMETCLDRFAALTERAIHHRSHRGTPEGIEAVGINELLRFVSVASDATHGILHRHAHRLDDGQEVQALYESTSAFVVRFEDRVTERGLLRDAEADDDLWRESPSSAAPRRGGHDAGSEFPVGPASFPEASGRSNQRAGGLLGILLMLLQWIAERLKGRGQGPGTGPTGTAG